MIVNARPGHIEAINAIYNQAVRDGLRTAHTEPVTIEKRKQWLKQHADDQYPVFVFLDEKEPIGWLSISPYRSDRQALDEVAEISYYVSYDHHGEGVATALMNHALDFCRHSTDYRLLVAILVGDNKPSRKLLEKFSFREGGRIPDALRYKDQFRDHLYMFKTLR